ncbi:hypothetical protein [Treponema bryantii]|uniref:hypothetical protein n=1 Tax=Treponema bryantii TaxID=163 RepID=UPI002B2C7841|nr:hypothetical protein TRBR_26020 [Treponema bryantii]
MKKSFLWVAAVAVIFVGCSADFPTEHYDSKQAVISSGVQPEDVAAWEAEVDADFADILAALGTEGETDALAKFDAKYGTDMLQAGDEFAVARAARAGSSGKSGSSNYPAMTDMPFNKDGAVYISGGTDDLVGSVIDWVSPKTLPGSYYHGAVLDLDKYDPNNENVYCLETAITKGAGYETATDWRNKVNACVLNPKYSMNKSQLDYAQNYMDTYCNMNNKNMEYGFFKNTVNIFNVVTKADTYTWYCTKVVWWVYDKYGWDIDSNSNLIDWTTSGLYTLVKDYYAVRFFYSSKKKQEAINDYIATAKTNIVLAEEILLSPYFNKAYEKIREY